MEALSEALDARDGYTAGHAHSVVEMVEATGRRLGLSQAELEALRCGALFHDIGKIGVPDWDGSGYPDALRGEQIPLGARVVLVCDAYHAMTSDRPYRAALDSEEALRRLREEAGRQFDPSVVDAFLGVFAGHDNASSVPGLTAA